MTVLSLSSILSSLSAASLSNHLAVLRRDINNYYIDHLLTRPASLTHSFAKESSGISSETLSILPSASEDLSMRLKNLTSVLDFLDAHLFSALPSSLVASFKKTLCKPVTAALLQQFLVPFLPSSLAALPPYLHLVTQAKELEERYIVGMLGQDPRDREVKTWTDTVSSHYERKRRAQILENTREMILRGDDGIHIRVEVDLSDLPSPPPSSGPATQSSGSGSDGPGDVSDDAWGLEGEESGDTDDLASAVEEVDAWGFDDGPVEHELAKPGASPESPPPTDTLAESEIATPVDEAAWGWDDSIEEANPPANTSPQASSSDNSADWDDDPWGESSNPSPPPPAPTSVPKPASRLEKLANKAKVKAPPSHTPTSAMSSPGAAPRPPPPAPARPSKPFETNSITLPSKKKEKPGPITQAETYAISKRAQLLADTVDAILNEGEEFAAATIFGSTTSSSAQARGLVILQTAPAVLDLFRALYPVKFDKQPTEPKSIVFANDCTYTRGRALGAARRCSDGAKDRLLETADSLNALGKRWFKQSVVSILDFLTLG